jgi:pectin methylesterase-like acyl-CoA thioesterase
MHGEKMTNKKGFGGILALLLVFGVILVGCVSSPRDSSPLNSENTSSERIGTASNTYFISFGEKVYPSTTEAARNGSITKIVSVEYDSIIILWGLYTKYTTIVKGE